MEKRNLGNTGMPVTVLGYGAMEVRHVESRAEAERLLNSVLDNGINYIDTSPDYQLSETYLGQVLAQRRREFYLASKCGCNIDQNGKSLDPPHIWNRVQLLRNIETSLRLLKTDYLDVWQLHGVFPDQLAGGRHGSVKSRQHAFARRVIDGAECGEDEFLAVGEIMGEAARGAIGGRGDLAHGEPVEALGGDDGPAGLNNFAAARVVIDDFRHGDSLAESSLYTTNVL